MLYKTIPINEYGRDFVVGDIHGQYDLLISTLDAHHFEYGLDRLFSVGDLIDRGPQNLEVLALIDMPWFHAVLGNHEDIFVGRFRDNIPNMTNMHRQQGGLWADGLTIEERDWCLDQIAKLPQALEFPIDDTHHVGIVHAAVPGDDWNFLRNAEGLMFDALWSRDVASTAAAGYEVSFVKNISVTVSGHSPVDRPIRSANRWFIDTFYKADVLTVLPVTNLLL